MDDALANARRERLLRYAKGGHIDEFLELVGSDLQIRFQKETIVLEEMAYRNAIEKYLMLAANNTEDEVVARNLLKAAVGYVEDSGLKEYKGNVEKTKKLLDSRDWTTNSPTFARREAVA